MKSSPPVVLSTNTIIAGVFVPAGNPLPFRTAKEVHLILRPFLVAPQAESVQPQERQLGFAPNKHYGIDQNGFALPSSRREAAEMTAEADERDRLVDELADASVDPLLVSAIEAGQEFHASASALEVAEARYAAKERDLAFAAAEEQQKETVAAYDLHGFIQPAEETPKPQRKLRRRFVRRGAVWRRAQDVRPKVGERVFIKTGTARYEEIGRVGTDGELPAVWLLTKGNKT